MAISQVPPLSSNVPIVYPPGHPSAGCPTPAFATLMQILLDEKAITDALAEGAIQPGTVTTSGLTAAAQRILGNKEATTGAIEELTLSQVLDLIGSAAQGDLLYRGASSWSRLPAGTNGQFLKTLGAGANPAWATVASGGGGSWALAGTGTGHSGTGVYNQTTDGNQSVVAFTGLAGKSDIMVMCVGTTRSASAVDIVQVSVDNGVNYFTTSGDYVIVPSSGSATNSTAATVFSAAATAAKSGIVLIKGANVAAPRLIQSVNQSDATRFFLADTTNDIDAVRVSVNGGGNFTGGKIYCFAR